MSHHQEGKKECATSAFTYRFSAQWRSPADTIVGKRIWLVHDKEGAEYLPLYRICIFNLAQPANGRERGITVSF